MKKAMMLMVSLLVGATTSLTTTSAAVTSLYPKGTAQHVNVYVNDATLQMEVPAQVINNRTMVPLRSICEALGAEVQWKQSTNTVVISKDTTTIELKFGSTNVAVNGQAQTLDVPPQVINNRTLVPVRFLSNALGAHIGWDPDTQSVFVSTLPQTTIDAVHTYFQSLATNFSTYLNAGGEADQILHDYLGKKISYTTFKSEFDAKVSACQAAVDKMKNTEVPNDPTVQKMAAKQLKIIQESVDYFNHCENAIYSDHNDATALKNAYAEMNTVNADEDAFFAEYTYH